MWEFLSRVLGRSGSAKAPPETPADNGRISSMLEAIDAGVAQRALPTLVCRACGLKYENTGTYLSGARCPDCARTTE